MTLRKQLIWVILMTVIIAIGLSTFISSTYMDTFFKNYVQNQYDSRVSKIETLVISHLKEYGALNHLSAGELERLMEDPIIGIQILDLQQRHVLSVRNEDEEMHNTMMRGKRFKPNSELLQDQYDLTLENQTIGTLLITRNASLQSSESVMLFKQALRIGALISAAITLIFSVGISTYLSQRLSKDLKRAAAFASDLQSIDLKNEALSGSLRGNGNVKGNGSGNTSESGRHLGTLGLSQLSNTLEISAIELSLNDLYSKLRLQNDLQRRQADQLSHEARTPLTLLRTQLEGALDGVIEMDASRLESCLHDVETLTQTLGNINQVLEISNQDIPVTRTNFDLTQELKKIAKGMKLQFEQKEIDFNLNLPHELPVSSDPVLLSQVVYNLLTNAYKFTPPKGQVNLSATLLTDENSPFTVEIIVADTGIGVGDQSSENLFKAYYRDSAVRHIQGEGLGLYISKKNMDALGGSLELTPNEPWGTMARVVF